MPQLARAHPKALAADPPRLPLVVERARGITGSRIPVSANTIDANFDVGRVEEV